MSSQVSKGPWITDLILQHKVANKVSNELNKHIDRLSNPLNIKAYPRVNDMKGDYLCHHTPRNKEEAIALLDCCTIPFSFKRGNHKNEMFVIWVRGTFKDGKLTGISYHPNDLINGINACYEALIRAGKANPNLTETDPVLANLLFKVENDTLLNGTLGWKSLFASMIIVGSLMICNMIAGAHI